MCTVSLERPSAALFSWDGANSGTPWYLYGPNGQSVASAGLAPTLKWSSAWMEPIRRGLGQQPDAFGLLHSGGFVRDHHDCPDLGTIVSASIANPGDQQLYTFTGTPGQRITMMP